MSDEDIQSYLMKFMTMAIMARDYEIQKGEYSFSHQLRMCHATRF